MIPVSISYGRGYILVYLLYSMNKYQDNKSREKQAKEEIQKLAEQTCSNFKALYDVPDSLMSAPQLRYHISKQAEKLIKSLDDIDF